MFARAHQLKQHRETAFPPLSEENYLKSVNKSISLTFSVMKHENLPLNITTVSFDGKKHFSDDANNQKIAYEMMASYNNYTFHLISF